MFLMLFCKYKNYLSLLLGMSYWEPVLLNMCVTDLIRINNGSCVAYYAHNDSYSTTERSEVVLFLE